MVANTENIRRLNSYLNFKSRIKITDGRTFIGTFVCVDKEKNIILAHTEEFRGAEKRLVGLIMIPGKHIVKIETEDLDASSHLNSSSSSSNVNSPMYT
ncbi:hypothetical protein V8B55DRAFT_1494438 [Mucor lusitanicus]|uniref:Sm domain-containing protein n=1 Tax=Mucor circinelloides f. lusitanicus TaxID=29924 RepID=A0A8H4BMI6_MUCCL|nr:hypothetical protein FB192DRAFT_1361129 [Mucor lusitanicus]